MHINIECEGENFNIQQNFTCENGMELKDLISSWPMRGVLLDTGNISATIVAKIVTVSIMATPAKSY